MFETRIYGTSSLFWNQKALSKQSEQWVHSRSVNSRRSNIKHWKEAFTQGHSRAGRFMIDPEADPTEHYDEYARKIGLEHEVTDIPLEFEAER